MTSFIAILYGSDLVEQVRSGDRVPLAWKWTIDAPASAAARMSAAHSLAENGTWGFSDRVANLVDSRPR